MLRLFQYKGSVSVMSYVDNIRVVYTGGQTTSVSDVVVEQQSGSDAIYNLNGQRVSPDTKGLLIRNGKKYVNK